MGNKQKTPTQEDFQEKYFIKSNIPWPTLLSSTLTNTGAVTFQSTLNVTGTTTLSSNATVGGTLTVTGDATFNTSVSLNDTDYLYLGTSNDFRAFHNGTNTYLENQTGDLYVMNNEADGDVIFMADNGSGSAVQNYIVLDGGDLATKIETIKVLMPNLPTSDPSVAGQLWNNSGDLKISAG